LVFVEHDGIRRMYFSDGLPPEREIEIGYFT